MEQIIGTIIGYGFLIFCIFLAIFLFYTFVIKFDYNAPIFRRNITITFKLDDKDEAKNKK
ncbi:MAG: hypothetical protein K2L14_02265 [Duncaniella sp.]|nr:hypothetical protein [Duncaniella sp.]